MNAHFEYRSLEDMTMTTIDFTPLFRTMIGFDRMANAMESAYRSDASGYPPYNIELVGEDHYRITMAVAGFNQADLDVQVKENFLTVSGARREEEKDRRFLHRGIGTRSFERQFQLADYVRVSGAELKDGLLNIDLVREIPETVKPRRIEIQGADDRLIESRQATARVAAV